MMRMIKWSWWQQWQPPFIWFNQNYIQFILLSKVINPRHSCNQQLANLKLISGLCNSEVMTMIMRILMMIKMTRSDILQETIANQRLANLKLISGLYNCDAHQDYRSDQFMQCEQNVQCWCSPHTNESARFCTVSYFAHRAQYTYRTLWFFLLHSSTQNHTLQIVQCTHAKYTELICTECKQTQNTVSYFGHRVIFCTLCTLHSNAEYTYCTLWYFFTVQSQYTEPHFANCAVHTCQLHWVYLHRVQTNSINCVIFWTQCHILHRKGCAHKLSGTQHEWGWQRIWLQNNAKRTILQKEDALCQVLYCSMKWFHPWHIAHYTVL